MDDDAIRSLLTRLGRAHRAGGTVIERAAALAAGADSEAVLTWILDHGGQPEAAVETATRHACTDRVLTAAAGPSHGLRLASCSPPARLDLTSTARPLPERAPSGETAHQPRTR